MTAVVGVGGSGFWLLRVRVNVNYLALRANRMGIKSLRAVNYAESLGSTTHPPKKSALSPSAKAQATVWVEYGWIPNDIMEGCGFACEFLCLLLS